MRRSIYIRESVISAIVAIVLTLLAFVVPSKLVVKYLGVDFYIAAIFILAIFFVIRLFIRRSKRSEKQP